MSGVMGGVRYAVYFAPPVDHPLWQAGCAWLGRDPAVEGERPAPPQRAEPWRYGFHATLKPPFRLTEARDEASLLTAMRTLAARHPSFTMPMLEVGTLANFVALQPFEPLHERHPLRRLADACVLDLDAWRAPLTAAEHARRQGQGLDAEQQALLHRHGYPHVLQRWRFHMTLSDPLPDGAARARMCREAEACFAPALGVPLPCDALSLFIEPAPGAPFRLLQRVPLG